MKNTHREVLLLVLKVTLLGEWFLRFLHCATGTKLHNASHSFFQYFRKSVITHFTEGIVILKLGSHQAIEFHLIACLIYYQTLSPKWRHQNFDVNAKVIKMIAHKRRLGIIANFRGNRKSSYYGIKKQQFPVANFLR